MTNIISPLNDFELIPGRKVGNTTRLIDRCIQIIYSKKVCMVQDHYQYGEYKKMNRYLFDKVRDRLAREHKYDYANIIFNSNNLFIHFKDVKFY